MTAAIEATCMIWGVPWGKPANIPDGWYIGHVRPMEFGVSLLLVKGCLPPKGSASGGLGSPPAPAVPTTTCLIDEQHISRCPRCRKAIKAGR